jgi:hypothetical protein
MIIGINIYHDKIIIMRWYSFENREGTYSTSIMPAKGLDEEWMYLSYAHWRIEQGKSEDTDTILYRTFKRDYLKFWKWSEYMTNDLYEYPFKEPKADVN